jgi:predicted site-specific integrase-resolvase
MATTPQTPQINLTIDPDRLMDEHAAAQILDVSVKTLRRWRWAGSPLPFVKVGSAVRYSLRDIHAFIAAGKRRSTSDIGPEAP